MYGKLIAEDCNKNEIDLVGVFFLFCLKQPSQHLLQQARSFFLYISIRTMFKRLTYGVYQVTCTCNSTEYRYWFIAYIWHLFAFYMDKMCFISKVCVLFYLQYTLSFGCHLNCSTPFQLSRTRRAQCFCRKIHFARTSIESRFLSHFMKKRKDFLAIKKSELLLRFAVI